MCFGSLPRGIGTIISRINPVLCFVSLYMPTALYCLAYARHWGLVWTKMNWTLIKLFHGKHCTSSLQGTEIFLLFNIFVLGSNLHIQFYYIFLVDKVWDMSWKIKYDTSRIKAERPKGTYYPASFIVANALISQQKLYLSSPTSIPLFQRTTDSQPIQRDAHWLGFVTIFCGLRETTVSMVLIFHSLYLRSTDIGVLTYSYI